MVISKPSCGVTVNELQSFKKMVEKSRGGLPQGCMEIKIRCGTRLGCCPTGRRRRRLGSYSRSDYISGVRITSFSSYSSARNNHTDRMACAICLEDFSREDTLGELSCGHAFHDHCIQKKSPQVDNVRVRPELSLMSLSSVTSWRQQTVGNLAVGVPYYCRTMDTTEAFDLAHPAGPVSAVFGSTGSMIQCQRLHLDY
ncbi:hypothetical protein FOZ62_021846 [Perkinsus olseni]|uniref:RING-type domain-containing protein n=1 Tax=Perkinsus olseni TaxID=32597 RepID=A0A7J6NJX2_PEROL|nr:hypothetical protein FOZ62_021846 [Perkinsus olseni]